MDERPRVELAELCDAVRSGRWFRAVRHTSGEGCTEEVLATVLASGLPQPRNGGAGFAVMVSGMVGGIVKRVSPPRSLWMRLRAPSLQGPNSRADRRAAATRRTVIGPAPGAAYWDHRSRR